MSFASPFYKLSGLLPRAKTARTPKNSRRRRSAVEALEERQLLTWVATFAASTGQLTIQGVGLSSDTGVLKVDANSGEIYLDGNNSGNFVDTGANLATINTSIQIEANTTLNSNFIIDNNNDVFDGNHVGAFFEAPATFPALTPLFVFTGSTAAQPSSSLTITGESGVANTFNVTPGKTQNQGVVVLSQPPNVLNQQNILTVDYSGVSGNLSLNGINGPSGNDTVILNDNGAATDWTLNGNTITGPAFPPVPTVPPTPPPLPGTVGDITYTNVANLQFNNITGGDLLTINSVAAKTTASDIAAETTVVNYNQPLAFPVSILGVAGTAAGTLDIVGALGGNNDFYVDAGSVADAAAGTKPQYNTPFTHLGSDLTYTTGTLKEIQVAGNGGNNTITVQVPPVLLAPYKSDTLPATFDAYGGVLPPVLANTQPPVTTVGATLLRVLGNAPGSLTTGADTITVGDLAGGNGNNANTVNMSQIAGVVIYGDGGDDTLTNNSVGNIAQGIKPVPALFIGGSGNDTMTGGGGSDMFLGGGPGHNTLISKTVSTPQQPTTTYFFPHQDQFGNIYDQLLSPSNGDTTSTLTGAGGNQIAVTGAVDPALSVNGLGDLDMGNLANPGINGAGGGGGNNKNGGQTLSVPTVPPGNVTAPLYMVTPALTALEDAMGVAQGQFPANVAALLEFGGNVNLTSQFATYAAFVGRAYNDFLIDRGGNSQFGNPVTATGGKNGNGNGNGTGTTGLTEEGVALVSPSEINYWVGQGQLGLTVQQMQAQVLAADELQTVLPDPEQWIRFLWESVTGQLPTDQVLAADDAVLVNGNTPLVRYELALQLLTSPIGEVSEINDAYANVVPGGGAPSAPNLAAIEADLSAGQSLPQVAATMSASNGNYLNYETTNQTGFVGFVAGVYTSVLHRPAGASDLSFWASEAAAGLSNTLIATIILDSPEARTFIINDAYEAYLGRPADPGGMAFWQSAFAGGMTDEQFIGYIIASSEYYADNGGTSQGYVTALYRTFLGRTAMQSDIDYWVSQLGMSTRGAVQARADIAVMFQQTAEYRTDLIAQWYQLYDGRAPSAAEVNAALLLFDSGATQEDVQAAILAAK